MTGNYTSTGTPSLPIQVSQTNYYDKYDPIYSGPVDANSDGFRPTVTLTPNSGLTLVAQRVQFTLKDSSTGGLNGLYEFNPNSNQTDTDFQNSVINRAGMNLSESAIITSIAVSNNITYVGGNFSAGSGGFQNIFSVGSGNSTALPNGGLNAEVSTMIAFEDLLYIAGNFTNTMNGSIPGLNNIAAFNITSLSWQALGAGVSGPVNSIVPLDVNITPNQPEACITFNGFFNQLNSWGSNTAISTNGFGIWVPSRQNWLQNLHLQSQAITGELSAMTNVSGSTPIIAGSLSSQDMSARDAVSLLASPVHINPLNIGIQPQPIGPVTRKRAISGQNVTGVVTGLFYNNLPLNVTVLGGHFTASASNGSTINNLAFLNNTGSAGVVSGLPVGLDTDSVFLALAPSNNVLYAGGSVTGKVNGNPVNGLVVYDLGQASYSYPQPAAFGGSNVAVNAITMRPTNKNQVFVGGSFETAGSLPCPGACVFQNGAWSQPGTQLGGSVSAFTWQGNDQLLVGGNLTVNNNATSLATYNAASSQWLSFSGAAGIVPGPVTALSPANGAGSEFWVAGKGTNGSAFLMKWVGTQFKSIGDTLGTQTTILGLSVLPLNKAEAQNELLDPKMVLLVTGQLNLPTFGNTSAALFNGTTFSPFILSTSGNGPGSLSQLFSEKTITFPSPGRSCRLNLLL